MNTLKTRKRASVMDKIFLISLIATVIGVVGLVFTTWLSIRSYNIAHDDERADFERYKTEFQGHRERLENELVIAKKESRQLTSAVALTEERDARASKRTAELEQQLAVTRDRTDQLERQLESANERNRQIEKELGAAKARAENLPAEPPGGVQKNITDAEQRSGPEVIRSERQRKIAEQIAKFAPANAAIFYLEEAPESASVAASLNSALLEGGWVSAVWKWTGVSGIVGLVVLTKEGEDIAVDRAAAAFVEACRTAGFNAVKADWPANWARYRGTLLGPSTPAPTQAPIRVVIGAKSF